MPGFDNTAGQPRGGGAPAFTKALPERSGRSVDEAGERQLHEIIRQLAPLRRTGPRAPGKTGLQQMHVGIGFEWQSRRHRGRKSHPLAFEMTQDGQSQPLGLSDSIQLSLEHVHCARQTEQRKGLIVQKRGVIERRTVGSNQRSEQSVRAAKARQEIRQPLAHQLLRIACPIGARRVREGVDLPRLYACAARQLQ